MAKYCVIFLGAIATVIGSISAGLTQEEKNAIKTDVIPLLIECGKEFEVSKEQFLAAKESLDVDALNPCFYACFLKKAKVIDEEGKYVPEVVKADHAKYIHDEELVTKLDAVSDTCASVNDKEVSDGAKGCDRAKLIVACLSEHNDIFSSVFKE